MRDYGEWFRVAHGGGSEGRTGTRLYFGWGSQAPPWRPVSVTTPTQWYQSKRPRPSLKEGLPPSRGPVSPSRLPVLVLPSTSEPRVGDGKTGYPFSPPRVSSSSLEKGSHQSGLGVGQEVEGGGAPGELEFATVSKSLNLPCSVFSKVHSHSWDFWFP